MASVWTLYGSLCFLILQQLTLQNHTSGDVFSVCSRQHPECTGAIHVLKVYRTLVPAGLRLKTHGVKWTKHGSISVYMAEHEPLLDITICMDVAINPGPPFPVDATQGLTGPMYKIPVNSGICHQSCSVGDLPDTFQSDKCRITYSQHELLSMRHGLASSHLISRATLICLKTIGILRSRGKRGGRRKRNSKIPVMIGNRPQPQRRPVIRHSYMNRLIRVHVSPSPLEMISEDAPSRVPAGPTLDVSPAECPQISCDSLRYQKY